MRNAMVLAAMAVVVAASGAAQDEGFTPLTKGTDPSQFELVGITPESITVTPDGEIRLTGKPDGYFATKSPYHNYVLKYEWMYERPEKLSSDADFEGNSGLLLHIEAPHKIWPKSIEAQLYNKDAGRTFAINGAKFEGKHDPALQKKAIKPVGEWNEMEVTSHDGELVTKVNGIEVARGKGAAPDAGTIGWQAEGAPIRFRNLRIQPMR